MNAVDVFLIDKLDVYRRLTTTFENAEERFWKELGKTVGAIVREIVGLTIEETFSTADSWKENSGSAYHKELRLSPGLTQTDKTHLAVRWKLLDRLTDCTAYS